MQPVERYVETTGKGLQLLSRQIPMLFLDRFELVNDHGIAIPALEFTVFRRNITALPGKRQPLPLAVHTLLFDTDAATHLQCHQRTRGAVGCKETTICPQHNKP
jgi:hypothetical protein